jgi:hypothetical protein
MQYYYKACLKFKSTYSKEYLLEMKEDNSLRSGISHHKFIIMVQHIVIKEMFPQGGGTGVPKEV